MKNKLYAVKDVKVGFHNPVAVVNDAVAKRSFANAIKGGETEVAASPEDFELWYLGTFDTETGLMEVNTIEYICGGKDYV